MRQQHSQFTGNSIVVHPPVDPAIYATKHGKKITMVNFHENKNPKIFWELARRNPTLEFLAVKGGYGVQELEDLPNVEIMENTPDPREYLAKTKIILMPSFYESYGRVPVEAAACGIPAIVSPTPGLRTSLGDSATFVDPTDVDGWNSSVNHLLKPRVYGDASKRAFARSEWLWDRTQRELETFTDAAQMTIDLYRKLK
jgi:glycosyltransferase involved in cell wall biosynthesis